LSCAIGFGSHAIGSYSLAEGWYTKAVGRYSHAEGDRTAANGDSSHAEGYNTVADAYNTHAEGWYTTASGWFSHSEGRQTVASGQTSHAQGTGTIADYSDQTAIGRYNVKKGGAFILGNGTADDARSNALMIDWDGNVEQNGIRSMSSYPTPIPASANLNDYVKPGNYYCASGSNAATQTNPPWTTASYGMLVFRLTSSANQTLQVAWLNGNTSRLKFRIRNDGGTWGSWRSLATGDGDLSSYLTTSSASSTYATISTVNTKATQSTPTFTLTDTANFTLTGQYLQKSGRIACVHLKLTAKAAIASGSTHYLGTLSPAPAMLMAVYGKSGDATPQCTYFYNRASNNIALKATTAIAKNGVLEINGCYCTAS
jgi:hypothetical protein